MKTTNKKPMMIIMAIVQNPITGRTKKKFGNAVFSKQFGKNTLRTKPLEVKNPKTPGQVNQRSKFKLMVFTSRVLLGMIRISFQNMAIGKSAFNAFMQANIKTAITGVPGNYIISFPDLKVAKGPLFQVQNLVAGNDLASKVKRTWDIPINPLDTSNNDKLYNVAYNPTKNEWSYGQPGTLRSAGTDEQGVPANWTGDTVHVYTFFISPDGRQCSDSIYSGTVVIQ
jgi:hypothetical protein